MCTMPKTPERRRSSDAKDQSHEKNFSVPQLPKDVILKSPNSSNVSKESISTGAQWFLKNAEQIMSSQSTSMSESREVSDYFASLTLTQHEDNRLQVPRPIYSRKGSSNFSYSEISTTSSQQTPVSDLDSPFSELPPIVKDSQQRYRHEQKQKLEEVGISRLTSQQAEQFRARIQATEYSRNISYPTDDLKKSVQQLHKDEMIKIIRELTGGEVQQSNHGTWLTKPSGKIEIVSQLAHLTKATSHKETMKVFKAYAKELINAKELS